MTELQTLNRIEQLLRTYTKTVLQATVWTDLAGTTSATPNQKTLLVAENPKRVKLFIQNPSSSTEPLLIEFEDKDNNPLEFELANGREFNLDIANLYMYTGPVYIKSAASSIPYYAFEVERL